MVALKALSLELPHLWLRPWPPSDLAEGVLSEQERRWCGSLPPPQRRRYAASRSELRRCLAMRLGLAPAAVPLDSPPGAAPRLEPGFGCVSLSHSGSQLLLAWSPAAIGVDLEWAGRPLRAAALAQRFFPAPEQAWLLALPEQEQRSALLASWVRKEAAIKWQGTSLASDLRHWCWDDGCGVLRHQRAGWTPDSLCRLVDGWWCAAVGEGVANAIWG